MKTAVVWHRNILRIHDNPLLDMVHDKGHFDHVVPIYIVTPEALTEDYSVNRKRFLFQSLLDLKKNLDAHYKMPLLLLQGDVNQILSRVFEALDSGEVELICDYCTHPSRRTELANVESLISEKADVSLTIVSSANTLLDIETVVSSPSYTEPKSMKDMQKIFKRAFKSTSEHFNVPEPRKKVPNLPLVKRVSKKLSTDKKISKHVLSEKKIASQLGKDSKEKSYFPGGESEALDRVDRKISDNPAYINNFSKPSTVSTNERNNPFEPTTTGLSAYLAAGCLSPRLVWRLCVNANLTGPHTKPPVSLTGQLMFREMFYLLSRSVENWDSDVGNSNCKNIEWDDLDKEKVRLWEEGKTGFPLIDAMMRQLDATGWMHHLGRHAVSCFFTRGQLWQNWKYGRDVFDRKLIDSDWALNNGNWLWLAGVAPFSMPYFRIYNPCPTPGTSLNVETDEAQFIRHWIPELKSFPSKYIFEPHLASEKVQRESNCIIGVDYPEPMVDRKISRKNNLAKFKESLSRL